MIALGSTDQIPKVAELRDSCFSSKGENMQPTQKFASLNLDAPTLMSQCGENGDNKIPLRS